MSLRVTDQRDTHGGAGGFERGLEALIGKPAETWSADDLIHVVERLGLRLVGLMHVGGDGSLKTLDFVPRDQRHLRDILTAGERADGSSLFKEMGIPTEASDILLRPRIETAFLDPFASEPTLAVLCSHAARDGSPLPASPDTILRRAFARLERKTGVRLMALGEVEYFLGKRATPLDVYGQEERGYHATSPFVFGEPLRREALAALGDIGLPVKYGHSEVGYIGPSEDDPRIWEQHEIELNLAPLPDAADAVVLAQWVLRQLARRSEMLCSFDPIMRKGHAGSGMHVHLSPMKDGLHLGGRTASGELPRPALWLIGGLVRHGGALMAFGNRTEGSFVRLSQGKEAPNTVVWGEYDRKALVRLPIVATNAKGEWVTPPTIEFRLPDGSAHPHLLLAGIAQAVADASELSDLDEIIAGTASGGTEAREKGASPVPTNSSEIAGALARSRVVLEAEQVFPASLIDHLLGTLQPPGGDAAW
jgi:glutamine synthetase